MTTTARNRVPLALLGLAAVAGAAYTLLRSGGVVGEGSEPLISLSQADFLARNRTLLALAGAAIALALVILFLIWARAQLPRRHLVDRIPLVDASDVVADLPPEALARRLEDDLRAIDRDAAPAVHVDGVAPLHLVTEAKGTPEDLPLLAAATSRFSQELRPLFPDAVVELTVELLPPRRVDRVRALPRRPVA